MKFTTGMPGITRWPPDADWGGQFGTKEYQGIARAAERAGFDAIGIPEHVVMPRDMVDTMGAYWPDAFTVMAFVAGATETIRVNSNVIVLPYHPPVQLAKAVATLDVLSGGRVSLTFGVGMAKGEFEALGVPFERRGRVTDEYLEAMRILWTEDEPHFEGEFVRFHDIVFEPKPVQRPHPPMIIGGRSIFALRRAARAGDGWAPTGAQGGTGPWLNGPEDLPEFLAEARAIDGFAERADRFEIHIPPISANIDADHKVTEISKPITSLEQLIDRIASLEELGVTWTSVPPLRGAPRSLGEHLEYLDWAGREVLPRFK